MSSSSFLLEFCAFLALFSLYLNKQGKILEESAMSQNSK